jgi:hypothetical protein
VLVVKRRAALVLTLLTLLFLLRVAGQALVAFTGVSWLPPMEAWYSGLLPYPILFPVQVVILAMQGVIDRAAWMRRPWLVRPRPRAGRVLRRLSYLYALGMAVRLALTGTHMIPVVFHWILAAYLYIVARMWEAPAETAVVSAVRTRPSAGR